MSDEKFSIVKDLRSMGNARCDDAADMLTLLLNNLFCDAARDIDGLTKESFEEAMLLLIREGLAADE